MAMSFPLQSTEECLQHSFYRERGKKTIRAEPEEWGEEGEMDGGV